jgi:hypothetical protein
MVAQGTGESPSRRPGISDHKTLFLTFERSEANSVSITHHPVWCTCPSCFASVHRAVQACETDYAIWL